MDDLSGSPDILMGECTQTRSVWSTEYPPQTMPDYFAGSNSGVWDGAWGRLGTEGCPSGDVRTGPSGATTGSESGMTVCLRTGLPMLASDSGALAGQYRVSREPAA